MLSGTSGLMGVHSSNPLCRTCRRVRFLQLLSAVVATHFNCFASDLHLDRLPFQFAVTSRTRLLSHGFLLQYPNSGKTSKPFPDESPLSKSLAILRDPHSRHGSKEI